MKKPIATSIVWNYFGLEANEGGDHKAVCCACKRNVPAKGVIRVILMSHLKEHYAKFFVEALSTQKTQQSKGNTPKDNSGKDLANLSNNSSTNIKDVLLASRKYSLDHLRHSN